MPAKAPPFRPGDLLPGTKYQIVRQLGAGGMGVVYQVMKPPSIQGVLKLMGAELAGHEEFRTRFFDEVRILAQLDHPNIVKVFDYDALYDGTPYYVMELLNGRNLGDALHTMGRFPPRVAYEVTRQLLEALHCAHTHDVTVVHRDIKPENVFLHAPKHGEPIVKLIDFGVIAVADRQHDGSFVGTWKYAAPEQIRGENATPATDLYAVGLVLYEMLVGAGPFDHHETGPKVAEAHVLEAPVPVSTFAPWVPPSIEALIDSALSKDPRQRPKDAFAFAERLYELQWATDGSNPRDATAEGAGALGPIMERTTEPGLGSPSRESAPMSEEDDLLAGLSAPADQKPLPKKALTPTPRGPVYVSPRPPKAATPRTPVVTAETIDAPATDTFAPQKSDPRAEESRLPRWLVLAAATFVGFAVALGTLVVLRARRPVTPPPSAMQPPVDAPSPASAPPAADPVPPPVPPVSGPRPPLRARPLGAPRPVAPRTGRPRDDYDRSGP